MDLAQQVIVYASRGDRALGLSNLIAGASRIGKPDMDDLSRTGAGAPRRGPPVPGDRRDGRARGPRDGRHEGPRLLVRQRLISTDVTLSLRRAIPPSQRCLVKSPGAGRVWRIPDEYLQCVADRLLAAFPELRRAP